MFNVRIKDITHIALASVIAISCTNKAAKDAEAAQELFNQANISFESGNYEHSILLLDSIDQTYPQAFDVRKSVAKQRPQVMERKTARELSITDSLLVENQIEGNNLRKKLKFVKNPLEGYYVASSIGDVNVREIAGLHGRISPSFKFYLTSSCPIKLGCTSIRLEADDEFLSSAKIQYDGERNNRSGKCETLTFTEAESAPLGEFTKNHANCRIDIVFISDSGKEHKIAMTNANKDALITGYSYAQVVIRDKQLQIEKSRLEKQLEISRMQIARTQTNSVTE